MPRHQASDSAISLLAWESRSEPPSGSLAISKPTGTCRTKRKEGATTTTSIPTRTCAIPSKTKSRSVSSSSSSRAAACPRSHQVHRDSLAKGFPSRITPGWRRHSPHRWPARSRPASGASRDFLAFSCQKRGGLVCDDAGGGAPGGRSRWHLSACRDALRTRRRHRQLS